MGTIVPPSDKRITIRELAEMAGTTCTTVSRALRGKPRLSAKLREKIIRLAEEHNYVPNQFARSLQRGGSSFLGFLAADLMNFTYIGVFRQLEALCRESGYSLIIADSEQRPDLEREHVEYFLRQNVRGMFVFPVSDWKSHVSNEHLDIFIKNRIPVVALGHISRPGISTVVSEEKLTAGKLVGELRNLGHSRFLIVAHGVAGNIPAKIRLKSLTEAISAIPGGSLTDVIKIAASPDWKTLVIRAVQRQRNRPTVIITINEHQALALYRPLAAAGIKIPEDISLATCGSGNWIEQIAFPLTCYHINIGSVVKAAKSLLFEKMDNPSLPDRHLVIPQEIHFQESVVEVSK